jgi:predicted ferric reductase
LFLSVDGNEHASDPEMELRGFPTWASSHVSHHCSHDGAWNRWTTPMAHVRLLSWRFVLGFRPINADLEFLDDETVVITVDVPKTRPWDYKAGQYIFVQVPQIARFQWHPFTVSTCINNRMQVHIKANGDWTNQLRDLAKRGQKSQIKIGLDGPFGAPAQRFYDFEYSMVFG